MNPLEATQAPNGLLLSPAVQAVQQANGTFSEIFNVDGMLSQNPALAAVVWWLAVILLGWLAFPLTFVVLRGLPDRGYALARILSLLLVSYFGWLMASLNLAAQHARARCCCGLLLLVVVSVLIFCAPPPRNGRFCTPKLAVPAAGGSDRDRLIFVLRLAFAWATRMCGM